jgi:Ulp1 family protease
VHSPDHWCLAVINFVDKRFEYYDSYHDSTGGQPHGDLFENLGRYVVDEARTHSGKTNYSLAEWKNYVPEDIPQQGNIHDCGVFTCKFADYLSEGLNLAFSAADIPYFRKRMLVEIMANRVD